MKNIIFTTKHTMSLFHRSPAIVLQCLALVLLLQPQALMAEAEAKPGSERPARVIVAKVNGQPIFQDQIEKRLKKRPSKIKNSAFTDSTLMVSDFEKLQQALDQEILVELYYQGGKKLKLPNAEEKVSEMVLAFKAKLTDAQQQLYSDDAIRSHAERRFYVNEYMVANDLLDPQVPEDEVKAYYEETKQGYVRKKPAVNIRHILVRVAKDASSEEQKQAHEKIEQARLQLLDGKDFADVAKEYSEDINNALSAGNLGDVEPGFMPPEFDKVAFSIAPDTISEIVETKHGYHILKVLKKLPKGSIPEYAEMREFFAKYLAMGLVQRKRSEHARVSKEKANIEIFLDKKQVEKLAQQNSKL